MSTIIGPFSTHSLEKHPQGPRIADILAAALQAVDPAAAVRRHLHLDQQALIAGKHHIDLPDNVQISLAAFGKAAFPMASAAASILGDRVKNGVVITKYGHAGSSSPANRAIDESAAQAVSDPAAGTKDLILPEHFFVYEAGHPLPDEQGVAGAERLLAMVRQADADSLVICLVSGGGSALLTAPASGISLAELGDLTGRLLASGADIHEINTIRKHLSQVKGGRLAAAAAPARVVSLILSDVVGDDLNIIASGPTVPDPGSYADAARILEKYGIPVPGPVRAGLRGKHPETPKPGDPLFEKVTNILVGTNRIAAEAALAETQKAGFRTRLLTTRLTGEAGQAGAELAAMAAEMPPMACWVAGGETTVTLGESPGLGGRNQELALAAVGSLAETDDVILVSLATDGGDGPTDAAGAAASNRTLARAQALGLDPKDYLARHDAYHFFEPLGDLIKTGPTRTNVNDLVMMFSF